ncbi:oxidoreductase [Lithospermum erythrorhizon]|uniref:4-hydroxy-tetrahydrodipicolinate reductase n=1 Tax=Lithospermum erythrorhizon TaxID=34254 RepID=A0AAV3NMZ9_LITER
MAFSVKIPISCKYCFTSRFNSTQQVFVEKPQRKSSNYFTKSLELMNKKVGNSCLVMSASTSIVETNLVVVDSHRSNIPIMVNGCTGKMGRSVFEAAINAGLQPVPISFGGPDDEGKMIEVCDMEIKLHGASDRESILSGALKDYPDLIVVDYTVPAAVNENAELYSKVGVPFVMGTTGGDRELLYKTVSDSNIYAVISPQMGKQVVAFLAAMEIMSEQFPGAFAGYSLQVMESHQASKLDASGTAKAVISCFQKLGVSYDMDEIQLIRDPSEQVEMVGVPEQYLAGHAFHMYHLTSPDKTVSFEFQHNVCGRSIYAEGTVDAVLFLAKKIQERADKKIYDMIDVLREGKMR